MPPEEPQLSPVEPVAGGPPPLPPARVPFWGYTDLALVIGLLLIATFLIGGVALVFMKFYPKLATDQTALIFPTNVAFYIALYLALRVTLQGRYGMPVFASLGWRRIRPAMLWTAVIAGVPLAFAANGVAELLHTPKVSTPFDNIAQSPVWLALIGAMAVIAAPVFEELFFRGFLQPLVSRTLGVILGVLITAILFGSLHAAEYQFQWQYVVVVSLVGIVLGAIRAATNSLIPGTIVHGCYNASFVIALAVTKHT